VIICVDLLVEVGIIVDGRVGEDVVIAEIMGGKIDNSDILSLVYVFTDNGGDCVQADKNNIKTVRIIFIINLSPF